MLRSDKNDIQSLIDYIKDIKPFHTKLSDVLVEYHHHDLVGVTITDAHKVRLRQSSTWDYNYISNGITNRFRLPAVVLPRFSFEDGSRHLWTLRGIEDAIPQYPTAYRVPYNNGMEVFVNGVKYTEGVEYVLTDPIHDVIYFNPGFEPVLGDKIEVKLINLDQLFININGVWAQFKIQGYIEPTERYDPYVDGFDGCSWGVFIWGEDAFDDGPCGMRLDKDQAYLHAGGSMFPGFPAGKPIGWIRVLKDSSGGEYYVFVFDDWIFQNYVTRETKLHFRVEQVETYNNIARTVFGESLKFADKFAYRDDLNVVVRENAPIDLGWDVPDLDVTGFDQDQRFEPWFRIRENIAEDVGVVATEQLRDRWTEVHREAIVADMDERSGFVVRNAYQEILDPLLIENFTNGWDLAPFDTAPFDFAPDVIRFLGNPTEEVGNFASATITDSVSFVISDIPTAPSCVSVDITSFGTDEDHWLVEDIDGEIPQPQVCTSVDIASFGTDEDHWLVEENNEG